MVTLTDSAVEKVKEALASQPQSNPEGGIRVSVVGGGCSGFQYSMSLEKEAQEGDQVVALDGFQIFIDEHSQRFLNGTEIDFIETSHGAGFRFNNPNVSSTCGCGESFQV